MTDKKDAKKAVKLLTKYVEENVANLKDKAKDSFGKKFSKGLAFVIGDRVVASDGIVSQVQLDFNQATDLCQSDVFDFPQITLTTDNENKLPSYDSQDVDTAVGLNFNTMCPSMVMVLMDDTLGYHHEIGYLLQRNPIVDKMVFIALTRDALAEVLAKNKLKLEATLGQQALDLVNSNKQFLISNNAIKVITGQVVKEEKKAIKKDPLFDGLEK